MQMCKPVLVLLALLSLGGCASYSDVKQQRVDAIPDGSRAYVIGAFMVTCAPLDARCVQAFNSISLFYRSIAEPHFEVMLASTPTNMFGGATTYDILDPANHEMGYYFCDTVPAGRMNIFSYSFYNFAGGGSGFSLPREKFFSVPFDASAGEVVNVGRLKVSTSRGENMFGMDLPAPGHLLLSDLGLDEQQLALKKCPAAVQSMSVKQALLRAASANGHPLVRDEVRQLQSATRP